MNDSTVIIDPNMQTNAATSKIFHISVEDFKEALLVCEIMFRDSDMLKIKAVKLIRLLQETSLIRAKHTVDMIQVIIRYCGNWDNFHNWITDHGFRPPVI